MQITSTQAYSLIRLLPPASLQDLLGKDSGPTADDVVGALKVTPQLDEAAAKILSVIDFDGETIAPLVAYLCHIRNDCPDLQPAQRAEWAKKESFFRLLINELFSGEEVKQDTLNALVGENLSEYDLQLKLAARVSLTTSLEEDINGLGNIFKEDLMAIEPSFQKLHKNTYHY